MGKDRIRMRSSCNHGGKSIVYEEFHAVFVKTRLHSELGFKYKKVRAFFVSTIFYYPSPPKNCTIFYYIEPTISFWSYQQSKFSSDRKNSPSTLS
jgi:hypothetical protein